MILRAIPSWKTIAWLINGFIHLIKWITRSISSDGISDSKRCLVGKTAIVTGGNAGIGYATSVLLASRGCRVIIACRKDASAVRDAIIDSTGNPNITTKYLDLSKLKTVRAFAEDIKENEPKIDILINNAGVGGSSEPCTEDGLNYVMQVNYFGHFLLTHLLVDQLKASGSANVVFLSSGLVGFHSFKLDDLNRTKFSLNAGTIPLFYTNSKLCSLLAAQEFGEKLRKYGIIVNCADPGLVITKIFTEVFSLRIGYKWLIQYAMDTLILLFSKDEYVGAQTPFHLAASRNLETGAHYFRCKPFIKPRILNDRDFCRKIWSKSEDLVSLDAKEKLD